MAGLLSTIRRRVALAISPELQDVPIARCCECQASFRPVSEQVEHLLQLGDLLIAHTGKERFADALGIQGPSRLGSKLGPRPVGPGYHEAGRAQNNWRRLRVRPPQNLQDKTYRSLTQWFSDNWPDELDWPSDVPRPEKSHQPAEEASR